MNARTPRDLQERFAGDGAVVAGVLSGTSADGIDVALARFSSGAVLEECLAFETLAFEPALGARVRAVLDGEDLGLRACALLSRDLGRAFGDAARTVADRAGVALDLVASHGQTVYHHDGAEPTGPATLQLGDGDFVAERAGAPCASDFRQADVAAGGEGAPLSALADPLVFARAPRPLALLNLGGMANLTLLDAAGGVAAFDTGPSGAWLDGLARRELGTPWDADGAAARAGRVIEPLLDALLAHPFFDRPPPKSTGRDTFGEASLAAARRAVPAAAGASPQDLLATATLAVARSVAEAVERFAPGTPVRVHLCGGGARNATLVELLARELGRATPTTAELGVDPDAREALVFAALGAARAQGIALSRRAATGAADGRVLGKLSAGPPAPRGRDPRRNP